MIGIKLDADGTVRLPGDVLDELDWHPDEPLVVLIEGDRIVIRRQAAVLPRTGHQGRRFGALSD